MKSHGAPSIGGSYMATARKHWFRVMDSIGRDDLTNDELATMIRLMGPGVYRLLVLDEQSFSLQRR